MDGTVDDPMDVLIGHRSSTQAAHRFPTTGGMDHNNNFLLKGTPEPWRNPHTKSGRPCPLDFGAKARLIAWHSLFLEDWVQTGGPQ